MAMNDTPNYERWMPPSPHRERLLETLQQGRAHIEDQGHGKPPVILFEDGGLMELPRYRWVDGKAVVESGTEPLPYMSRYSDVCGTIDALKLQVQEAVESGKGDPEEWRRLLNEAMIMIDRMFSRVKEYLLFQQEVWFELGKMGEVPRPDGSLVESHHDLLTRQFNLPTERIDLQEVFAAAEGVRQMATILEQALYPLRDRAINIGSHYERLRGARQWDPQR